MIKENINMETFMMIAKAGILLGQANPTVNSDKLLDELVSLQMKAIREGINE
ncbi:MAG: hypothetical protein NC408_04605 [Candidatus Gastranaerophilales bacterium]|nr:hypothetical protein [Candidatus Gastranaerophilales bacterium]MCM1072247.1 hypothetical protein [Bacteroides sp.]